MRFSKFMNEQDKFIEKELKELRTLCKPFIDRVIKDEGLLSHPLWRGSRKQLTLFSINRRRMNRKPKDTPEKIQKMVDAKFYKEFGWKPRSQGVFATGSLEFADNYGTTYLFLPIGNFHFVWSKDVEDFFLDIPWQETYSKKYNDAVGEWDIKFAPGHTQKINDLIDEHITGFRDNDLKGAAASGHEIMFDCDRYYMIDMKRLYSLYKDVFSRANIYKDILGIENNEI